MERGERHEGDAEFTANAAALLLRARRRSERSLDVEKVRLEATFVFRADEHGRGDGAFDGEFRAGASWRRDIRSVLRHGINARRRGALRCDDDGHRHRHSRHQAWEIGAQERLEVWRKSERWFVGGRVDEFRAVRFATAGGVVCRRFARVADATVWFRGYAPRYRRRPSVRRPRRRTQKRWAQTASRRLRHPGGDARNAHSEHRALSIRRDERRFDGARRSVSLHRRPSHVLPPRFHRRRRTRDSRPPRAPGASPAMALSRNLQPNLGSPSRDVRKNTPLRR